MSQNDHNWLPPRKGVPWYRRQENHLLLDAIRRSLSAEQADLLLFLGAGLSYGVSTGRGTFEDPNYEIDARFPGWHLLIQRMLTRLRGLSDLEPYQKELESFFKEQGPLDCAELFRERVGAPNYVEFLRKQFGSMPRDHDRLSRSHRELVKLPIHHIFTTNYDELIELAYRTDGEQVRVSASPEEFMAHRTDRTTKHIIKINGSIDRPDTIVLTRSDYARSRRERSEMLAFLAQELRYSSFLFVGFSLLDPNFNLLHDEARLALGAAMPVSYVVQGRPNAIKEAYLRAMGVNTVTLDWWEDLPQFMQYINPASALPSVT